MVSEPPKNIQERRDFTVGLFAASSLLKAFSISDLHLNLDLMFIFISFARRG